MRSLMDFRKTSENVQKLCDNLICKGEKEGISYL